MGLVFMNMSRMSTAEAPRENLLLRDAKRGKKF